LAPALASKARQRAVVAACATACVVTWLAGVADARSLNHKYRSRGHSEAYVPRYNPVREFPFEFPGSQYLPVAWSDIAGWTEDDPQGAFSAFRASCRPISAPRNPSPESKTIGNSLRDPCIAAKSADITDAAKARIFFEQNFTPIRISRLGEAEGFVTGYYEPIVDGSKTKTDVYTVPVYRRPSNLFVRGYNQASPSLPNNGDVFRKIGRRKLVPYYDRAQIEDGAIAGRGLEIAWLKSQTDLLFSQIQGSARVRMEDGSSVRINYDSHNGYRYTPVGRVLIERGIIPREQMSMQRIRQYFEENPEAANEVRRQNKAFVFFREVRLSDKDEAVGAQGVPLTPGRSIAVDKALHVYGTPFFVEGELPIETDISKTPFRRLMVAQDTGSAIVGPARADLYFGAGTEMGRIAGRIKHPAKFVMLVPKSLDPSARGHNMPLPDARPSAKIARLFPQTPASEPAKVESAKVESAKADIAKADIAKTEAPKVEAAKPEVSKPDVSKPEVSKPEASKAELPRAMPVVPEKPAAEKTEPSPEVKSAAPAATAVPLPAPKPIELAAVAIPAAAGAIPLPEARPQAAPRQANKTAPAAKPEAKPRRATYKRRIIRRAPAQSSSPFRFFWQ
jgi:membrane-bound lytic murein transglycosylase A